VKKIGADYNSSQSSELFARIFCVDIVAACLFDWKISQMLTVNQYFYD